MHGGWLHVIGNMWFLWVFGDNVEDAMGRLRYVVFYVACGLAAVVAQVLIDPGSSVPMVGASGAIAGVLGAYVVLYPRARIVTLVPIFIILQFVELPAFVFIFVWFGLQLLSGWASLGTVGQDVGGTAFFAHIGGFVCGLALVFLLRRRDHGRRRVIHRPRRPRGFGADGPWP
jgi:membrane associated rhomboid family serine protease